MVEEEKGGGEGVVVEKPWIKEWREREGQDEERRDGKETKRLKRNR
jgi:hypothetical protein